MKINNTSILFFFLVMGMRVHIVFAQQVLTSKGDKVIINDLKVEPWQVVGSAAKAALNTQDIYQQGNVGLGDFSTVTAAQKLDIMGNMRVRGILNANTQALQTQYNRSLVADADGNLGYVENYVSGAPWEFIDANSVVMPALVTTTLANANNVNLGLTLTVTIPSQTQAQIKINYSVPVLHSGTTGYMGVTLFKSVNGGADEELQRGSRKYTVSSVYNGGTAGISARGIAVSSFATDYINNTTNTPMTVTYKSMGYVESNASTVTFGMYATTGANYNWGRGAMGEVHYFRPLN